MTCHAAVNESFLVIMTWSSFILVASLSPCLGVAFLAFSGLIACMYMFCSDVSIIYILLFLLSMVGGLFVLISFVINSNPWDYNVTVYSGSWLIGGFAVLATFGWCFRCSKSGGSSMVFGFIQESTPLVVSFYSLVFLSIISLLVLSLFIINAVLNQSNGGTFWS